MKQTFSTFLVEQKQNSNIDMAEKVIQLLASMRETKDSLPHFWEIAHTLAAIPATSCSAERSFSALRSLKNYLRNSTKQSRLNNLAVLYIERAYCNKFVKNKIDKVIDTFGSRSGRKQYFF